MLQYTKLALIAHKRIIAKVKEKRCFSNENIKQEKVKKTFLKNPSSIFLSSL